MSRDWLREGDVSPAFRWLSTSARPLPLPLRVRDPALRDRIEERAHARQTLVAARVVDATRGERVTASARAVPGVGVSQEDLAPWRVERRQVDFGELVHPACLLVRS